MWYYRAGFEWYKLIKHILKAHLGKHVNDAYSQYCKQVYPEYKKEFWYYLERDMRYGYKHFSGFGYDDEGIIFWNQRKRRKKPTIKTLDYRTELLHEVSKKPQNDYQKRFHWTKTWRKGYVDPYKLFVVQGAEYEFDSRKDRFYRKLKAEHDKALRKQQREDKRLKAQKEYEFLTQAEKLRKADELDKQKLYSHGFDDKSFKGEAYHSKGKRKDE
jgi:hypothetical protein